LKKILLLVCFLSTFQVYAQTLIRHTLPQTPQSILLNPADFTECNFFIGIPALSAFQYQFASSSFAYADFITQGTGSKADSLIYNFASISEKVKKNNFIRNSSELVWLNSGWRIKKSYWSFSVKTVANVHFFYTDDLIHFTAGNWNNTDDEAISFQFSDNKPEMLAYTAFSVGFSKEMSSKWRLGFRASYLKGAMLFKAQKSDFDIITTENPLAISFSPDYDIKTSFPMTYQTDSLGEIYQIRPVFSNLLSDFLFNKNRGASFDFGLIYQYNKKLRFAASLLDVGFIFWKSNARTLKAKDNFTFEGFDLNQYTQGATMATDIKALLKDSVKNLLHYSVQHDAFLSTLPVRSFFSVDYQHSKKLNFKAISSLFFFRHAIFWQQNVSILYKFNSSLTISSGISYMNDQINNIGLAMVLTKKPVQLYFSTDNLVFRFVKDNKTNYLLPYQARALNVSFGINLLFGCNKNNSRDNSICPAYN